MERFRKDMEKTGGGTVVLSTGLKMKEGEGRIEEEEDEEEEEDFEITSDMEAEDDGQDEEVARFCF